MRLNVYGENKFSQNGEDGILSHIFNKLNLSKTLGWCVEFGAWNGMHLSNTFFRIRDFGWNGIYIEGNPEYFQDLLKTSQLYPRITPIQCMISGPNGGGKSLDDMLIKTDLPKNYDLLSVDIDSYDLEAWAYHVQYRPTVVIIEINSGIEPGILEWHHAGGGRGNSFTSTLNVALSKNYSLVCHTGNMIFVANERVNDLGIDQIDLDFPERLFLHDYEFQNTDKVKSGLKAKMKIPLKKFILRILK
jgi:hypothetical protein